MEIAESKFEEEKPIRHKIAEKSCVVYTDREILDRGGISEFDIDDVLEKVETFTFLQNHDNK